METSEQPIFPGFEDESRSYPPVYHASRPPLPGSDEARQMTVGSGRQCSMWLEQSSPLGAFSRILLESLHWTNSEEYCYVWNRLDTRFALSAFQLTPLGLSTDECGCSLFATPNTLDAIESKSQEALDQERFRDGRNRSKPDNLRDQIAVKAGQKLWRTPDANGDRGGMDGQKRLENGHALSLNDQAATPKLWPTPMERDWKSTSHANKDNSRPLSEVAGLSGSGSLNPRFVEELMGYEIDHTALKRSATPLSRSKPTRSSRRSPKLKI